MVFIDIQHRELTLKLVYYGPARSGKTTNLQQLHRMVGARVEGELVELDTRDDRTLFFDLLPLRVQARGGFQVRLRLFTVPGQVIHTATRKVVLQGVDGVAFIADSQVKETRSNNESFADLRRNLQEHGIPVGEIPVVLQFNKRDLSDIRTDEELAAIASQGQEPVYRAVALRGEGVAETFLGLAKCTWDRVEQRYGLRETFGVTSEEFVEQVRGLIVAPASDPT